MSKTPVLRVPEYIRSILSQPQGVLYRRRKGFVERCEVPVSPKACVGDVVCKIFDAEVKVVDGKTLRTRGEKLPSTTGYRIIRVVNPRSTISANARSLLTRPDIAGTIVVVGGEEDLLVIPLVYNEDVDTIVYGQPGEGVVVMKLNKYSRLRYIKMLKTFKPEMYG